MKLKHVAGLVLLSSIIFVAGYIIGQVLDNSSGVQPVVKAGRFEVVSPDGSIRAVLTTIGENRASLTLLDQNGESRAWLYLSDDGRPNLVLSDNPRFAFIDGAGNVRALQRTDENSSTVMEFYDDSGAVTWSAP